VDQTSDRNLKENLASIDAREVLAKVVGLPITHWNFKTADRARHIGPMAQDFYAAFGVGADDKHITTVDEGGVALAAIQGLNQKLEEKDAQIAALEKGLERMEKRLEQVSEQVEQSKAAPQPVANVHDAGGM
jgi:tetrahydromethanopterin S-methyltransferase subunit H